MFIRRLRDCPEFAAGDDSLLRELLHPDKADLRLRYSLAHAVVRPGQTTRLHALTTSEVYYIIDGEGLMRIDHETAAVGPGDTIYIPPAGRQQISNTGMKDLVFVCIVDPAWRKEDETVW